MNPLLEQFLQEARENLAFIDQNIENIGGDDPELLNGVFRAAHTLKGGSGIVGFGSVKDITHHAEDLLDMLRSNKITFKKEMLEALYSAFDEVMNLVEAAEETEEIADADEERVAKIIAGLDAFMGKSVARDIWKCPFAMAEDRQHIVNLPMPFLSLTAAELPFELGEFNETACAAKQLYAVVFDVDESCMVYGNDPVYTLSMLGDKVIGVYTCMDEKSAKTVLSGLDDPDALLLKVRMTVFIYATYEEIEDALFNFIDELQFCPLDVALLLQVDNGEKGHRLDLLKELYATVSPYLQAKDKAALSEEIARSLKLIGSDTIQFHQLQRLLRLLDLVKSDDLPKLAGFIASLQEGSRYLYDAGATVEAPRGRESVEEAPAREHLFEADEDTKEGVETILEQQLKSLAVIADDAALQRAEAMMQTLRPYLPSMPVSFDGASDISGWIAQELGVEGGKIEAPAVETEAEAVIVHEARESAKPLQSEVVVALKEGMEAVSSKTKEPVKKSVIGKTVKIEQESIDNLMNIVGELLVAKNSLPYLAEGVADMNSEMIKRGIMEKYTFINRLAEQLQDLIMSMRMLPISYVFDRYPKLARDISKDLGKKVSLTMEGGETKLDKNMIEMLADPLIHIMRNSLDHGIESPEIREKKGKNPEGHIALNAFAQSDKIIIEIKDDGAGINVEKVMRKVLEKKLMSIEQIDVLSDDEKAELVLLPGLSTVDEISEYSGRGVGMDVVKRSIENFGGTIRIRTLPNQGTTITLSIPVSLAVTSLLHVSMSSIHYGFPMDTVSETVKIEKEEIEYLHNEPFVYIRGEVIPLLFITSMLDETALKNRPLPIVVLNIKGNLLAVVVNELLGQLDVVQKPLEGIMEGHPIFSGTALLGNGQIIMAIDPLGLLGIAHVLKSDTQKVS